MHRCDCKLPAAEPFHHRRLCVCRRDAPVPVTHGRKGRRADEQCVQVQATARLALCCREQVKHLKHPCCESLTPTETQQAAHLLSYREDLLDVSGCATDPQIHKALVIVDLHDALELIFYTSRCTAVPQLRRPSKVSPKGDLQREMKELWICHSPQEMCTSLRPAVPPT